MQLHDTPKFKEWLDERKARFVRIHGQPDPDRTTCDTCGITTPRAQLLDGTTCVECLAADYGAHRVSVRLGGVLVRTLAAFAAADPRQAGMLLQHLGERLQDALTDYEAECAEQ